jgi:hypothetical protein
MLRVYVAYHCLSYQRTIRLVSEIQKNYPTLPIQVINLEDKDVKIPDYIIGTPTYVWDDQIFYLGNPTMPDLLDHVGHFIVHD